MFLDQEELVDCTIGSRYKLLPGWSWYRRNAPAVPCAVDVPDEHDEDLHPETDVQMTPCQAIDGVAMALLAVPVPAARSRRRSLKCPASCRRREP